jgi:hypothetical protein
LQNLNLNYDEDEEDDAVGDRYIYEDVDQDDDDDMDMDEENADTMGVMDIVDVGRTPLKYIEDQQNKESRYGNIFSVEISKIQFEIHICYRGVFST